MTDDGRWQRYLDHSPTLRGVVRHALVERRLALHLERSPMRIVDIGGGAGQQAVALARAGHQVTLVDPSPMMLDRARERMATEPANVARRIRILQATGEEAPLELGEAAFDAVLCHGVLMHVADPGALLAALSQLAADGAVISILAKNRPSLAFRAALERRWADARDALDATWDIGGLGVPTRGDLVDELFASLARLDVDRIGWYGVRVFTDHLRDEPAPGDVETILELEWEAGGRDPYRSVARLIHLIGRRRSRVITDPGQRAWKVSLSAPTAGGQDRAARRRVRRRSTRGSWR